METILIAILLQTFVITEPRMEYKMSFNASQFTELIVKVLEPFPELYSKRAVDLLNGTCAKETLYGHYIRQLTGPAKGIMQTEPDTFYFLQDKYKERYPFICNWTFDELEWNLYASIFMARLKYLSIPERIPDSLNGQAAYWKKYYNTNKGKGTVQEYLVAYTRYCNG